MTRGSATSRGVSGANRLQVQPFSLVPRRQHFRVRQLPPRSFYQRTGFPDHGIMPERSQVPPEKDGSHERPMKRKRVALACEACRERKVRCDGSKPVCRPCAKRAESSLPCVYSVISSSAKQVSEQE